VTNSPGMISPGGEVDRVAVERLADQRRSAPRQTEAHGGQRVGDAILSLSCSALEAALLPETLRRTRAGRSSAGACAICARLNVERAPQNQFGCDV